MPLYEYDCPRCGRFEVLQKMSDPPLARHTCGSEVKKLMSASSFAFKGSGFYTTDYKHSSSSMHDSSPAPKCEKPKSDACAGCSSNKAA